MERGLVFDMLLSAVMETEGDTKSGTDPAAQAQLSDVAASCLLSIVQDASVLHARVLPDLVGMDAEEKDSKDDGSKGGDGKRDISTASSMSWAAIKKLNKDPLTDLLKQLGALMPASLCI